MDSSGRIGVLPLWVSPFRDLRINACLRLPEAYRSLPRLTPPPVKQPSKPELFITLPPAPHLPVADPYDLGRLPPRDLLRHGPQNHFLYLHRPLHCGLRVRHHAFHGLLPSPPAKRTDHLLSQPDISCANDTTHL